MRVLSLGIVPTAIFLSFISRPAELQAQDGSVRVVPRIGVHSAEDTRVDLDRADPASSFQVHAGAAGFEENAILGVGVDVDLPPQWLDLRVALDRTVGAEVTSTETSFRTEASLLLMGTDLLFSPVPSARSVRPLLVLGWGMTRFAMDGQVPDTVVLEGSRIEGAMRLGAGVDLVAGPSLLRLEFMDSISLLGTGGSSAILPELSELQATITGGVPNDFLITVGVVVPID